MGNKTLHSITFPGLSDKYIAPEMASEFSTSTAYAVGDCVTYQGSLYRFTSAHSVGSWNSTEVTLVELAEEVTDLKSGLGGVAKGGIKYENVLVETGQFVKKADGTIASYPTLTTWATSPLYHIPEGTYEIKSNFNEGVGASSVSGFAVYDDNMVFKTGGTVLSGLPINEDYAYIRLTNYSTSNHSGLYVEFKISELINQIPVVDEKIDDLSDSVSDRTTDNNHILSDYYANAIKGFYNQGQHIWASANDNITNTVPILISSPVYVMPLSGYKIRIMKWDSTDTTVSPLYISRYSTDVYFLEVGGYYTIDICKADDGVVDISDKYGLRVFSAQDMVIANKINAIDYYDDKFGLSFHDHFYNFFRNQGQNTWVQDSTQISTIVPVLFSKDFVIQVEPGFQLRVFEWANTDTTVAHTYVSSWKSSSFALKKNVYYTFNIKKVNDGAITPADAYNAIVWSRSTRTAFNETIKIQYNIGAGELIADNLFYYKFENVWYNYGQRAWLSDPASLSIRTPVTITETCKLLIPSGYKVKYIVFESEDTSTGTFTPSTWYTDEIVLPANQLFTISIEKINGGNIDYNEIYKFLFWGKDLENAYNTLSGVPKQYYMNEADTTVSEIIDAMDEPCLNLFVCTDIHYNSTTGSVVKPDSVSDMATNMKYVAGRVKVDAVVNLGDDADNLTSALDAKNNTTFVKGKLLSVGVPLLETTGNHDYKNQYGTESITLKQTWGNKLSSVKNAIFNTTSTNFDYFVDYETLNLRLIFLNSSLDRATGFWENTCTWFANTALNTNKKVVVMSHYACYDIFNDSGETITNGDRIIASIQSFITNGGKFLCYIHGHVHLDYLDNSMGYNNLALCCAKVQKTTSQSYWQPSMVAPDRTRFTATEDCWNSVVIKPQSEKIEIIRFGAGTNRTITLS